MELFEEDPKGNAPEFTVSEISGAVKRVIEGEFGRVRVRGELGRVSRPGSGHVYVDLKDDRATLAAVIWKGSVRGLGVQPQEGLEVIATGRLTTFPGQSKYQMVIEDLAPAGLGALMAMLEKRKAALAAEGLFDAGRKRPIPYLPEVIGVVTSPTGAVIRDILHRLRERFPREVLVWPVPVQGERCAVEVAAAIRGFNALKPGGAVPRPDLLIVARGGGSVEDLWGFNEEIVVRAAAESVIPLISAVGHETDTTLIDLAADLRAPTPTAAAEAAVPVRLDLLAAVARLEERRAGAAARRLEASGQRLRDLARALPRPEALTAERAQRLDGLGLRLPAALLALARDRRLRLAQGAAARLGPGLFALGLAERRRALAGLEAGLAAGLRHRIHASRLRFAEGPAARLAPGLLAGERRRGLVLRAAAGLRPEALHRRIERARDGLEARALRLDRAGGRIGADRRPELAGLARALASLDPRAVLGRGYAIVRDARGHVLARAAEAAGARALEIEFADGRLRAKPEKPKGAPGQGELF